MPQGAGKYDDECTAVRERLGAEGIVLLVQSGIHGSGFSVQLSEEALRNLPAVLRELADAVERDLPLVLG